MTAKLIGTLRALDGWYATVRIPHASPGERKLYEAARRQIEEQVKERVERLGKLVAKLPQAMKRSSKGTGATSEHRSLIERWDRFRAVLEGPLDVGSPPSAFVEVYATARAAGQGHVEAVQSAVAGAPQAERWLEGLVERLTSRAKTALNPVSPWSS